jgi:hypothetical protein
MAKRLHDTDCWKKEWFRHLCIESKILWLYILDTCDCAGIWEKDLEMASFLAAVPLTDKNLSDMIKQLKPIDEKRFIVLDFIDFQYGELKDTSKMKKPVFANLAKFGLKYPIDTVSGISDTVKRKRKDKDKDFFKKGVRGEEKEYSSEFLKFWETYPRKEAKETSWQLWQKLPAGILTTIISALSWQTKSEQWTKDGGQFIPMPSTYLNQKRWEDQPPQPTLFSAPTSHAVTSGGNIRRD